MHHSNDLPSNDLSVSEDKLAELNSLKVLLEDIKLYLPELDDRNQASSTLDADNDFLLTKIEVDNTIKLLNDALANKASLGSDTNTLVELITQANVLLQSGTQSPTNKAIAGQMIKILQKVEAVLPQITPEQSQSEQNNLTPEQQQQYNDILFVFTHSLKSAFSAPDAIAEWEIETDPTAFEKMDIRRQKTVYDILMARLEESMNLYSFPASADLNNYELQQAIKQEKHDPHINLVKDLVRQTIPLCLTRILENMMPANKPLSAADAANHAVHPAEHATETRDPRPDHTSGAHHS